MQRVLIVEDEKTLAEMYSDKFKHEGFEVLLAEDGEKGLKMAFDEKPDILVLDILLPKKEGLEVLKEVRESGDWGKKVPIIMFTNLDSSDYILNAVDKYHPSYYFTKADVDLNEIVNRAKELLA